MVAVAGPLVASLIPILILIYSRQP